MIEFKENEEPFKEDTQDYDYMNEEPLEEDEFMEDEEPDYCD